MAENWEDEHYDNKVKRVVPTTFWIGDKGYRVARDGHTYEVCREESN